MKKYFATEYVSQHFKRLLEWNNLPHIRFHDLRHSCASILLSRGFTLKDVQEWLVHSDITLTANIYGHFDIERKKLLRILRQIYLLNLLEKVLDTVFFYSAFRGIKKGSIINVGVSKQSLQKRQEKSRAYLERNR